MPIDEDIVSCYFHLRDIVLLKSCLFAEGHLVFDVFFFTFEMTERRNLGISLIRKLNLKSIFELQV
jgi:hypothetical protein